MLTEKQHLTMMYTRDKAAIDNLDIEYRIQSEVYRAKRALLVQNFDETSNRLDLVEKEGEK